MQKTLPKIPQIPFLKLLKLTKMRYRKFHVTDSWIDLGVPHLRIVSIKKTKKCLEINISLSEVEKGEIPHLAIAGVDMDQMEEKSKEEDG